MVKVLEIEQTASLDAAIKKISVLGSSQPLQMRQSAENNYGRLYQKAVKRGEVQQIKLKYRNIR